MRDVIDRLIDGETIASLSEQDLVELRLWVDDPRNGMNGHLRRLITLLIYELRKARVALQ